MQYLRPLLNRVIVEQEPDEEETQNGIFIAADERSFRVGVITAIGPDVKHYEIGDKVMYVKEAAEDIIVDEGLPTELKATMIYNYEDIYVKIVE